MFLSIVVFLIPAAYQALAIVAGINQLVQRAREKKTGVGRTLSGVSVLKPLRGLDPNTEQAFLSQAQQDHPCFEILFGVADTTDPAIPAVHSLQQRFPNATIRLVTEAPKTPNGKVGVLLALAKEARFPIWVVNDSDIRVGPDYLRRVTAPLAEPATGLVTCLYRAHAHTLPAAWEAFGIATDFMPSTLVAPLVGVKEFGLGSTLAFRAADLQAVGGFAPLGDFIADDYQLAKRITGLGRRAVLSTLTVETALGEDTWGGVWRHQVRWARTIRTSKGGGYAGLPITHAGLWILLLLLSGRTRLAVMLWALRAISAAVTGGIVLRSRSALLFCWLAPLWDLYAFSVWLTSYRSNEVRWRDRTMTIDPAGRIR